MDAQRPYDRESYILVVDDDNTLLKFFKIHLNKFFSKVIVVKNAKEAIDTIRDKEIDLVITDIRMPRMDGLQLMKRVRKHDAAIPVLVVSGALLDEEQQRICHEEADGYLRKPFSVDELHDFINKGMERREQMKKLIEMIPDKAAFQQLLKGKKKVEKVASKEHVEEAREILESLREKPLKAS